MQKWTTEQKIMFTLRIACAMCFIGHGAFGIITKQVWCNYFGVFGIGQKTAYGFMPVIGTVDILFGLMMLFYPLRGAFAWLVIWGFFTAMLRPLSGEPLAEFIERAGNYGAPFMLLMLVAAGGKKDQSFFSVVSSNFSLNEEGYRKIKMGLRVVAFLLFMGHGWLNLIAKKGLIAQYTSLHFSDPHLISQVIGTAEIVAAFLLLLWPSLPLVFALLVWKMGSELFYPAYEIFEWIERGGSYGVLLSLWFVLTKRFVATEQHQLLKPFSEKIIYNLKKLNHVN